MCEIWHGDISHNIKFRLQSLVTNRIRLKVFKIEWDQDTWRQSSKIVIKRMYYAAVNSTVINTRTYFINTGSINVAVFTENNWSVNLQNTFLVTWPMLLRGTDHSVVEMVGRMECGRRVCKLLDQYGNVTLNDRVWASKWCKNCSNVAIRLGDERIYFKIFWKWSTCVSRSSNWSTDLKGLLTLILRRSRTGTVLFYTSTSNKREQHDQNCTQSH